MFRIAGAVDKGRSRACAATAEQALRQHSDMTVAGLMPVVIDLNGRRLSLDTWRGRVRLDAVAS